MLRNINKIKKYQYLLKTNSYEEQKLNLPSYHQAKLTLTSNP